MSSINKYEIFECDTCKRKTSKDVDPRRPTILNCTITHKCTGKLLKLGFSATKPKFPIHARGTVNWSPRGSKSKTDEILEEQRHDVLTGKGSLSIAVPEFYIWPYGDGVVKFEPLSSKDVEYKEYEYIRFSGTTTVEGPDDSTRMATPLYKSTDTVKVFINGVALPETEYDYPLTAGGIGRTLTFSPPLSQEYNSIKIVIFETTTIEPVNVQFSNQIHTDCAWGDIDTIQLFNNTIGDYDTYRVYTCSDLQTLGTSNQLKLIWPSDLAGIMLLGRDPWAKCDRVISNSVSLKKIANSPDIYHLEVVFDDGGSMRVLTKDHFIDSHVPLISIQNKHLNAPGAPRSTLIGNNVDTLKNHNLV